MVQPYTGLDGGHRSADTGLPARTLLAGARVARGLVESSSRLTSVGRRGPGCSAATSSRQIGEAMPAALLDRPRAAGCGAHAMKRGSSRSVRPAGGTPCPTLLPLAVLALGRLLLRHVHQPLKQHGPGVDVDEP